MYNFFPYNTLAYIEHFTNTKEGINILISFNVLLIIWVYNIHLLRYAYSRLRREKLRAYLRINSDPVVQIWLTSDNGSQRMLFARMCLFCDILYKTK